MIKSIHRFGKAFMPFTRFMDALAPLADLLIRFWIAQLVFITSWSKITFWQHTLSRFMHIMHVQHEAAACVAVIVIIAEFIFGLCVLLGFGGRVVILLFFIYNGIAWLLFPHLWMPEGGSSTTLEVCWSLLLLFLLVHGTGKWSIDAWLRRRYERYSENQAADQMRQVNQHMRRT